MPVRLHLRTAGEVAERIALPSAVAPRGPTRVVPALTCALALAVCALAALPASGQTASKKTLQPNILLIVLDDVGTDKLRIYHESDSATYASAPWCGSRATTSNCLRHRRRMRQRKRPLRPIRWSMPWTV